MARHDNSTSEGGFHVLAFSMSSEGKVMFVIVLVLVYLFTLAGNILIITLVGLMTQLKTSMYFFLANLSILDILYISSTVPKLLLITWTGDQSISYTGCMTQLYFYLFCAGTESFLLSSMSIDRYIAVCKPLHYSLIMSKKTCIFLVIPAWCMGAFNALILTSFVTSLKFCSFKEINHFFCDLKALLIISCGDQMFSRKFILVDSMCIGVTPFALILASYMSIIATILKIRSSEGQMKAFSRCSSHLLIVSLYYGSALFLYMRYSQEGDKFLSVMFVLLVPMLNPLVYSLRNKDILRAVQQIDRFIKIMI